MTAQLEFGGHSQNNFFGSKYSNNASEHAASTLDKACKDSRRNPSTSISLLWSIYTPHGVYALYPSHLKHLILVSAQCNPPKTSPHMSPTLCLWFSSLSGYHGNSGGVMWDDSWGGVLCVGDDV